MEGGVQLNTWINKIMAQQPNNDSSQVSLRGIQPLKWKAWAFMPTVQESLGSWSWSPADIIGPQVLVLFVTQRSAPGHGLLPWAPFAQGSTCSWHCSCRSNHLHWMYAVTTLCMQTKNEWGKRTRIWRRT